MTIPLVPVIPVVPNRTADNETEFRLDVDAYHAAIPGFSTGLNVTSTAINATAATIDAQADQVAEDAAASQDMYAAFAAGNLGPAQGTSSTSVAIGSGSKSFTASTDRLWYFGLSLYVRSRASSANFMVGRVTAYNPTTGALTIDVPSTQVGGSGTFTDWDIYPAGARASAAPNVVSATKTDTASTTSTSFVDSGLSVTITLGATDSRVLLSANLAVGGSADAIMGFRFVRGSTPVAQADAASSRGRSHMGATTSNNAALYPCSGAALDSPGSAGPFTYKLQWLIVNPGTAYLNRQGTDTDVSSTLRGVSTLTAIEMGAA